MVKLKTSSILVRGKAPTIAVSANPETINEQDLERLKEINGLYNIVMEGRFDLISKVGKKKITDYMDYLNASKIPVIFTYRGRGKEVREYYELAEGYNNFICDIDIDDLRDIKVEYDPQRTIISTHEASQELAMVRMREIITYNSGAGKIASYFDINGLAQAIWEATSLNISKPFSIIPLGESSRKMRIATAILCSDFTYCYLHNPTSEGQFSLDEMISIFLSTFG